MGRRAKKAAALIVCLCMAACLDQQETEPRSLVVQAYLYEGAETFRVQVSETAPFGEEPRPVEDATVTLWHDGQPRTLVRSLFDPGAYLLFGGVPEAMPGEGFRLEVTHEGRFVEAFAEVPPPPEGFRVPLRFLRVERSDVLEDDSDLVEVRQEGGLCFEQAPGFPPVFLRATYVEDVPRPVSEEAYLRSFGTPLFDDCISLPAYLFQYYGEYRLDFYRAHEDYLEIYSFYDIAEDEDPFGLTDADLLETPGNVEGGHGIFAAFSVETVFVEVQER